MLELLALFVLAKRIGAMVEQKGYKSGGYKLLTVVLWLGGEILGAFMGVILTNGSSEAPCIGYMAALMGAAAGGATAYWIANNLSPKTQPSLTLPAAESLVSKPTPADIEARVAAGLCPKCGNTVAPADKNCPFCRINLAWARQNPDQLAE